jgi:hypothetical protein
MCGWEDEDAIVPHLDLMHEVAWECLWELLRPQMEAIVSRVRFVPLETEITGEHELEILWEPFGLPWWTSAAYQGGHGDSCGTELSCTSTELPEVGDIHVH